VTESVAWAQTQGGAANQAESLAAFQRIYEAEFTYVWNALRRLGLRSADLEDAAQEVFVVAMRRLSTLDLSRPIRPWLFGVALKVVSDFKQLARHRREIGGTQVEGVDGAAGPEEAAQASQSRRIVQAALEELDLDSRAVVVMHDLRGHAMPEVAEALAIPLNTAYSRLRLARPKLAAAVLRLKGGRP
jgi:RNA polymerase sigma-70 factor (ECF subfamily)